MKYMVPTFDEAAWWNELAKPDWYVRLQPEFARLEKLATEHPDEPEYREVKHAAYPVVEKALRIRRIPLAENGEDFDAERKPIDTIVIHHTKGQPGIALPRLSAMQLLRIYAPHFAHPNGESRDAMAGGAVWSGHFYQGEQVFWGYHWLVRQDGSAEQILADDYIGWHAGDWDVNTRSIGICIDDNLTNTVPGETVLQAIAEIIQKHYGHVAHDSIVAHSEVNRKTECPGHLFHDQWQRTLLAML